ncbi:GH116 family glycosyl-hydrolase [Bacteroidota bacterium]
MKKVKILFLSLILPFTLIIAQDLNTNWPVLKHYDQDHLAKIALPLGGIGTGTVSLGGHGGLLDWEIMNRPAKGFNAGPGGNRAPFFAIYTKSGDNPSASKALLGPIEYFDYESKEGRKANNHGLPRFRNCTFHTAYPFGQVVLSDNNMPVDVRLEAFNPMIPADPDNSGIPIAVLRYVVKNKTDEVLEISVCGNMTNFIGEDGLKGRTDWKGDFIPTGSAGNKNSFRKSDSMEGIYMDSDGVDKNSEQWGTIALTTNANEGVSYRTTWLPNTWGSSLLDFWDDFIEDGILENRKTNNENNPMASLAVKFELQPGESNHL